MRGPLPGMPTYTANLCPSCGRFEFASSGEDFGEAIRKSIEAASRRAIGQGPTEHLDGMLSEEQSVNDTIQTSAGRNGWRFWLWGQMTRLRAGQWYSRCKSFDVTWTYRIVISGSAWPSNFISAGKVTLERIISLAYVCLSWCGTIRIIPAAAVTSWRQYRS